MHRNQYLAALLEKSDAYCGRHGISRATFSNMIARQAKFLDRIAAGGDCTTTMYDRYMRFFAAAEASGAEFDPHIWIREHIHDAETQEPQTRAVRAEYREGHDRDGGLQSCRL